MHKKPMISLIMPIHNEEEYLPKSLKALKIIEKQFLEFIFILDRCTDNSEKIVMSFFPNAIIIRKTSTKWKNSLAENFQLGLESSKGNIICTQDADATAPANLKPLLASLKGDVASVAPTLQTSKDVSFLNRLYYWWEKTRKFAPLGEEPRGAFRLIRRECLEQVGGFKDVIAQETQLDIELRKAGFRSIVVECSINFHLRKFSFQKAVRSQIKAGKMRKQLNMPFWRVLGHSLFRLRPFVVWGYLSEKRKGKKK